MQVLQEFYVNATGKMRGKVQPHNAVSFVRLLLTRPVVATTPELFLRATDIRNRYHISYWDAAIVAAAVHLGCATLYTQDLNSGQTLRRRNRRGPVPEPSAELSRPNGQPITRKQCSNWTTSR